jgi:hypothetical protein
MTRQCLQDGFRLIDELFGAQEDNPGVVARRECKLRQRCEPPLVVADDRVRVAEPGWSRADGFRIVRMLWIVGSGRRTAAVPFTEPAEPARAVETFATTPTASAPRLAPEGEEILATLERIERIAGYEG